MPSRETMPGANPADISLPVAFAALFGWVVFGEAMSARQLSGGVLILAGIWIARPSGQRVRQPGA